LAFHPQFPINGRFFVYYTRQTDGAITISEFHVNPNDPNTADPNSEIVLLNIDHSANTNDFAGATWLVRQVERDAMFSAKPPDLTQPSTYSALRGSKTTIINTDDHDVFGDKSVVIKFAPGHTPGHQLLYVKLANTGGVVLSGDLYHYPEERTLGRIPTFDDNQQQTAATRAALDVFLKKNNAQLWIQHDFTANAKLKKAPAYYD